VPVDVRLPTVLRSQAGARPPSPSTEHHRRRAAHPCGEHPGLKGQVLTNDGALHKFVNVYVNDDDVRYLQSLDTPVKDGDEISILPAVAGGMGATAEG